MDGVYTSGNITPPMPFFSDFSLQDFVDQPLNFDHVVEMIRGETADPITTGVNDNFDPHIFTRSLESNYHNEFCPIGPADVLKYFNSPTMSCTNNTLVNSLSGLEDELMEGGNDDDEDNSGEAEHSSATTTTQPSKKTKVDRSRTLFSERRRRGRMKEKLYALRALVPNITKMDKASIVGDAMLYVQDLQMQAKKLKSQIEGLESSFKAAERSQASADNQKTTAPLCCIPVRKIIVQLDVLQIEDKEFYVKVVCNKGQGVAAALYRVLESLSTFIIQCSNLTSLNEQLVLTFTLNVGKPTEDFNFANLKLWISGAFLSQGFELRTF